MAILTRAQIVQKTHGYRTETVPVPAWGGDVIVRELTTEEVTHIGAAALKGGAAPTMESLDIGQIADMLPQIVAWATVDDSMQQILTLADVQKMTAVNIEPIQIIAIKALELSGLVEGGEEATADPN